MKSMKVAIMTLIAASMFPLLVRSQTTDQAVVQITNNPTEMTTGEIKTPWINTVYEGTAFQSWFNDADNTFQNGRWGAVDVSQNLKDLNFDLYGNVAYTWDPINVTMAEQPFKVTYMLRDTLNGHSGVLGKLDRKFDRYEIEATIAYTDTATNQPASITFKLPNHMAKYIMDWDTTAPTPFDPGFSYSTSSNPQKVDSILNNIYDVMVLPQFEQNKENIAQMNETSPYSGSGYVTNTTLENISDGGVGNPWNPEIFSMIMTDHSKKGYNSGGSKPNTEGGSPPDDDDLDAKVFKTANGNVTVKYFMPDTTVTHPGATWGNTYEMTISDTNYVPDVQASAGGLPTNVIVNQVNDTTYNVTVSVDLPDGSPGTYTMTVDLDAMLVGTPELPERPNFNSTAFPNPVTPNSVFQYSLRDAADVNIAIYDMQGRKVEDLYSGKQQAGTHQQRFDISGQAPGMYQIVITSPQGGSQGFKIVNP